MIYHFTAHKTPLYAMFSKSVFRYCKVSFYPPNIDIVLFYGKYTNIDVQYQEIYTDIPLVTQPMMQRQLNPTELRLMDSYIQILCRFQKSKRKVPPPSPLSNEKSPFTPPKENCSHPLGG
jgi:hypothetical protein